MKNEVAPPVLTPFPFMDYLHAYLSADILLLTRPAGTPGDRYYSPAERMSMHIERHVGNDPALAAGFTQEWQNGFLQQEKNKDIVTIFGNQQRPEDGAVTPAFISMETIKRIQIDQAFYDYMNTGSDVLREIYSGWTYKVSRYLCSQPVE